jgi:hypothetical protein
MPAHRPSSDAEARERAEQIAAYLKQKAAEDAERRAREATTLAETLRVTVLQRFAIRVSLQLDQAEWSRIKLTRPRITIAWGLFRIPVKFQAGQPARGLEDWYGAVSLEGHLIIDQASDLIMVEAVLTPRGQARPDRWGAQEGDDQHDIRGVAVEGSASGPDHPDARAGL